MINIQSLALTESVPTKLEISKSVSELANHLYEGEMTSADILRTLAFTSAVIEACEGYKKMLASAASKAIDDYDSEMNGNTLEAYGVTFTRKKGKPEYDYEGDDYEDVVRRETEAKAALKAITDERKAIEKLHQATGKAIIMYTNEPTVAVTIKAE